MFKSIPRSERAIREVAKRIVRDHLEKLIDTVELPEWLSGNAPDVEAKIVFHAKAIAVALIKRGNL